MWVVSIVALILAVARAIFSVEAWRLAGLALTGVCIQAGLYYLICARWSQQRRRYAFWAGFELGSFIALWSFLQVRVVGFGVPGFFRGRLCSIHRQATDDLSRIAGFVMAGSLLLATYVWAMLFTGLPLARYVRYCPGGPWYAEPVNAPRIWIMWINYTALGSHVLGRPPYATDIVA
jgi:hypothetical protein